jgi:hypothetical protein
MLLKRRKHLAILNPWKMVWTKMKWRKTNVRKTKATMMMPVRRLRTEVPPKRKRSAKHDSDEVDGGENGVRVRSSK